MKRLPSRFIAAVHISSCVSGVCLYKLISRGLHYLALRIRERLGYIADELKGYDIIGLQEVKLPPEDKATMFSTMEFVGTLFYCCCTFHCLPV